MAMVAKAKARASMHLDIDDYRTMIHLHSVSEIASYLKKTARYQKVLEGVNEHAIHRDYLEQRIRSQAHIDFNALLQFMSISHHHFYEFYIKELEMHHILFVIHAIDAKTKYHLGKFLMDLNHWMSFDVEALAVCDTYDEVLKVLQDTPYEKVLQELSLNDPDLVKIEDQLHAYYNESMYQLIQDLGHHEEIMDLFRQKMELNDLAHAYRLKKYFKSDGAAIERSLNWTAYKIPRQKIHEYLKAPDENELLDGINQSYYGKILQIDANKHIEYSFSMILYKLLKRKMRSSNDSDVILFSYMNLVNMEIENIIDIIEGIRYAIPKEEIVDLLIL